MHTQHLPSRIFLTNVRKLGSDDISVGDTTFGPVVEGARDRKSRTLKPMPTASTEVAR